MVTNPNKMRHCSSYDGVGVVNTSSATEISARSEEHGIAVPSKKSPGVFVQFAGDNSDLNEETPHGIETDHIFHRPCSLSERAIQPLGSSTDTW